AADWKAEGDASLDNAAWDAAARCYQEALALEPRLAAAHSNLGFALAQMNRIEPAQRHLHAALEIDPALVNAHYVLATIAHQLGDAAQAIEHFRDAVAAQPGFAEAWNYLGNLLIERGDAAGAIEAYRKAAAADPASTDIMNNLAGMAGQYGDRHVAIAQYKSLLQLAPDSPGARLNLVHQLFQTCQWDCIETEIDQVRRNVREAPDSIDNRDSPFAFLALPGATEAEQRRCAEKWAFALYQPQYRARRELRFDYQREPGAKPHIAYLSADFHDHATARLMAEVFERHDRSRFTVSAYSYGPEDGSAMSARLEKAFDRFIDIREDSIRDAAVRIHADRVDILIDLKGYTGDSRSAILALCPAPIQVNYLGYPGTMGADFVDYLIADRCVIPESSRLHYREEITYLPDTYQPTDSARPIPPRPERSAVGLPEQGLVFCCFNQTYKITPAIFDIWCRLLRETEGSVLWLIASEPRTEENLRVEAQRRGVAAARLVFAPRTDPERHLARQQCADLFLDTLPYNAHTTCSDALWMGLPVVTWRGDTFPARVAASLLQALGVPELAADSAEAYYELALALAHDNDRRNALRDKIIAMRR
ncbi:MAG: tetratricopeptide repeat protein, partial [Burkholderiaceae bacterium]|nr:tetratricopeptide repeat protein [Burkholderiaceae bacterium]